MRSRLNPRHLYFVESALIGVFFIQAIRFLIGMLYSRIAGASVVLASDPATLDPVLPGVVDPALVTSEITFLLYMLLLPMAALVLGRFRPMLLAAAVLVATGRALMIAQMGLTPTASAAMAVGGGLLYVALLVRHRARMVPYFFIMGLSIDQLLRAIGNTLDPSWFASTTVFSTPPGQGVAFTINYLQLQIALSIFTVLISLVTVIWQRRQERRQDVDVSLDKGLMTIWGGIGMGALLFLELALLAVPNAVASRASVDYTTFVPLIVAATVLPIIPFVRARFRNFIALFDGSVRGWLWMLMSALLVVFGTRFPGIIGGATLVAAQFAMSMMWWWLVRPQAQKERIFAGLWVVVAVLVFGILAAGDFFTYEYAFVRNFSGNFAFLNEYVPPLLRGFRGLGLGVLLLGVFLAVTPMTQTRRRIPWAEQRQRVVQSVFALIIVVALSTGTALAARPPLVQAVRNVDSFRVGTYNIHAGYNEFFHFDMEAIARTIQQSGANVVMLQEVESGRLTSFGVDQPLWLARRLGMDRRYYPTNEGLQGLAILSNIPIVFHEGRPLTSVSNQTGLQHLQVSPDGVSAVAFYNTWLGLLLDLPGERTIEQQEQDQQRQLSEIFTAIARDYPDLVRVRIVLGGTFNNIPGSPLIEQIRVTGFNDPFAGLPPELSNTLVRTNLQARLDYLWTRNVLPLGAVVMDTRASDHRMAVVEILINRLQQ